jgi:recombination protein RecT
MADSNRRAYQRSTSQREPAGPYSSETKLRELLESKRREITHLTTPWLDTDKLIELTILQFATQPKLQSCTGWSILAAVYRAARAGLAPGTREANFTPFQRKDKEGNIRYIECQFVEQYQGVQFALYRTNKIQRAFAEVVYQRDVFDLDYGRDAQVLIHKPNREQRGKAQGAYGYILLKGARVPIVHFMHPEDIERVKRRSQGGEQSAWITDTYEMWRKTALKNNAKQVQLGQHLDALLEEPAYPSQEFDGEILHQASEDLFGQPAALPPAGATGVVVAFPHEEEHAEPDPAPVDMGTHRHTPAAASRTAPEALFDIQASQALDRALQDEERNTEDI